MLRSRRRGGFSKTARSRGHSRRKPRPRLRHLETVRCLDWRVAQTVARRRFANDLAERAAEGSKAREADIEADVSDASVRLAEQEHRPLDPPSLEVPVRCLPERGAEASAEVELREVGDGGHGADVQGLRVGAVHGVAGAQQAPVQVLGFTAHAATLRHEEEIAPPTGFDMP
jgi:hypothetical protein